MLLFPLLNSQSGGAYLLTYLPIYLLTYLFTYLFMFHLLRPRAALAAAGTFWRCPVFVQCGGEDKAVKRQSAPTAKQFSYDIREYEELVKS